MRNPAAPLHQRISPEEITASFRAVGDLLAPERDLSCVDRDDFGTLLRVLSTLQEHLTDGLNGA